MISSLLTKFIAIPWREASSIEAAVVKLKEKGENNRSYMQPTETREGYATEVGPKKKRKGIPCVQNGLNDQSYEYKAPD